MTGDTMTIENVYRVLCVTGESIVVNSYPASDLWELRMVARNEKDGAVAVTSIVLGRNEIERLAHNIEAQLEDLSRRRKE